MVNINEDLKKLIPPLSTDEYAELEKSLLAEGCRDPLDVWGDTLVDGHHRYEICTRHGIPYQTRKVEFADIDEAKAWIIAHQLGRRNLTDFARAELALVRRDILLAKGREKQAHGLTAPGKTLLFQNNKSVDDTHNTRKTIADDTKISTGQLAKVEQIIKRAPEEVKDKLRKGEVSIGKAYREIKGDTIATKWTGDQESYTPEIYVEAARSVMGSIDVDPASNDIAQKTIKAKVYYTKENNGLDKPWDGNIFLNPPYGHPEIKQFIDKLLGELKEGQQAILLTNNNTDTTWFHDAAKKARLICFTKGRINFYKSDGRTTNPTNGQVFFYFGKNHKRFSEVFGEFGLIMGREDDSIS